MAFGCLQEAGVGDEGHIVTRIRWAQAGGGISRTFGIGVGREQGDGQSLRSGRVRQHAGAGSSA